MSKPKIKIDMFDNQMRRSGYSEGQVKALEKWGEWAYKCYMTEERRADKAEAPIIELVKDNYSLHDQVDKVKQVNGHLEAENAELNKYAAHFGYCESYFSKSKRLRSMPH